MKEFKYTINDHLGIHARPAGMLVKEAARYKSSIMLDKDGKKGDAKRIFAVMALGAKCGDVISVRVDGEDENEAAEAMESFFKKNL